jgi:stearoyl-CoA desaturase (delta-9 desaturase)
MSIFRRDKTFTQPVNWITTFFMGAFHVGAIAALFFFTWKALALAVVLWWVSGSLGIGMGYHRLLTHRGYKTPKWLEYLLTVCATLALEGGPIAWVATHRVHHQNTDKEGDPHSPRDGGLWAHMGWIMTGKALHNTSGELLPFVPDLRKDKFQVWISKWHWVPLTVLGAALSAIGGWPFLLWGIFFRTVIGLHATWLVNSATHMWGSQRFLTGDTSTNSFWVAMLTFGEGQKTRFKDAFGLRSMDSLTPTVWAINRHDDSPYLATCTKSIREFLERNVPAAEPDDHLRSRRS